MKILLVDLETAPNLGFVWEKYEQDVIAFKKERFLLSFAYKWLGERQVKAYGLPDFRGYKKNPEDDFNLVAKLHSVFNAADVIVAHNGNNFDIKMANAAFARHGMVPTHPYKTVDTLLVARQKFRFNSNKLNDLGTLFKIGQKVDTGGFKLWLACLAGDRKAWAKMIKYNKQDIVLLEKVYLKLRPWMTTHPNVNVLDNGQGCPVCKSTNLQRRGWMITNTGRKRKYVCVCGKWSVGPLVRAELFVR